MVSAPRSMKDGSIQPDQNAINQITPYLEAHDLRLKIPTDCQLIKSKSMAPTGPLSWRRDPAEKARIIEQSGFWICPIEYAVSPRQSNSLTAEQLGAKALFEKMEQICPRFFNPGQQDVSIPARVLSAIRWQ
ncbi:MAG: hypothetical protein IPH15_14960 [Comamonadaceae bacterium]|nr:hypothetical protein [Comamonadaceae bacterium]